MLTTSPRRELKTNGEICFSSYECLGILHCCMGYGPGNAGRCYSRCNLGIDAKCNHEFKCHINLICCNSKCMGKEEHCISDLKGTKDIDVKVPITAEDEDVEEAKALSEIVIQQ